MLRKLYHMFNFFGGCLVIGFSVGHLCSMHYEGYNAADLIMMFISCWCCGHMVYKEFMRFCVKREEKNIYDFGYTPSRYDCFYADRR